MTIGQQIAGVLRPLFFLGKNRLSIIGAALTSGAGFALIFFYLSEVFGVRANPYAGIIIFLILPGVFVIGLAFIPFGIFLQRRKLKKAERLPSVYPQVDFNNPDLRRTVKLIFLATSVNAVLLSVASYRGVTYMDSTQFCGLTCHTVMAPEYTAYRRSPHARVSCTECHIGPGAPWFVRSKISGTRQLFAVTFNTYSHPIPSPVRNLRPARETCEECHWPEKFVGNRLLIKTKFQEDEKNTEVQTVLLMRVGGRSADLSWAGIHGAHVADGHEMRYVALDGQRQVIPWVEHVDHNGHRTVFVSPEFNGKEDQLSGKEKRVMDCMDCHNRPSHTFRTPEDEVNNAMAAGRLSRELPFLRREAVRLLKQAHPDPQTAALRFATELRSFYQKNHPEAFGKQQGAISAASALLADIYGWNVFPRMNITWGTYPNNLGHEAFPGCFRCHDGQHSSSDGKMIPNDCNTCHALLAMEEEKPKVLEQLSAP